MSKYNRSILLTEKELKELKELTIHFNTISKEEYWSVSKVIRLAISQLHVINIKTV